MRGLRLVLESDLQELGQRVRNGAGDILSDASSTGDFTLGDLPICRLAELEIPVGGLPRAGVQAGQKYVAFDAIFQHEARGTEDHIARGGGRVHGDRFDIFERHPRVDAAGAEDFEYGAESFVVVA